MMHGLSRPSPYFRTSYPLHQAGCQASTSSFQHTFQQYMPIEAFSHFACHALHDKGLLYNRNLVHHRLQHAHLCRSCHNHANCS